MKAIQRVIARKRVAGGGVTCSGSTPDGDNESFEKGIVQFCTTGWTLFDTDGVINTYDTNFFNTGTHSMSIIYDSDNSNNNRASVDLGSEYSDLYDRFYIQLPTLESGKLINICSAGNDNAETTSGSNYIQWVNNAGTYIFKIRSTTTNPSDSYQLTAGLKYRIERHSVQSGTTVLRVYDSSGTIVETNAAATELSITGSNVAMRYINFMDSATSTTASTIYVDDYKVDVTASGWIGAE